MNSRIRRILLQPLERRKRTRHRGENLARALAHLEQLAAGEADVVRLREVANPATKRKRKGQATSGIDQDGFAALVLAMYRSGRLSTAELAFHASMASEYSGFLSDTIGPLESRLNALDDQIDVIKHEHGLEIDDDWPAGEEPAEVARLDAEYKAVIKEEELRVMRALGYSDMADLRERDPVEYDRLRERGRRAVFHREEFVHALRDLVLRYEGDAERSAETGAYYAALSLLGAAVEGVLLLRCLRSPTKARSIAQSLSRRLRPNPNEDLASWRFEVLIEVCASGGWLPREYHTWGGVDHRGIAHAIRHLRNLIHPARHARDRPWIEVERRDYEGAKAMYDLLRDRMTRLTTRKRAGA